MFSRSRVTSVLRGAYGPPLEAKAQPDFLIGASDPMADHRRQLPNLDCGNCQWCSVTMAHPATTNGHGEDPRHLCLLSHASGPQSRHRAPPEARGYSHSHTAESGSG